MIFGGSPSQVVWITTSTSEMSGRASSGMCRIDQIPAMTNKNVPVKTRKRFRAHQSIHREIMSHASRSVHAELFRANRLAILLCADGNLPGATASQGVRAFVNTIALIGEINRGAHSGHSHRGHRRH